MTWVDVHTHQANGGLSILSAYPGEHTEDVLAAADYLSVGIHPWYVTEENFEEQCRWVEAQLQERHVVAIGECGLDWVCDTPFDLQRRAFRRMIDLSETYGLPMVLHVVKASSDILQLRKLLAPKQPWVIHGFRGKPTLATAYLSKGCFLSFGEHSQPLSLRTVPLDSLLLETDSSSQSIATIYEKCSTVLSCSVEQLSEQVYQNANRLFFK